MLEGDFNDGVSDTHRDIKDIIAVDVTLFGKKPSAARRPTGSSPADVVELSGGCIDYQKEAAIVATVNLYRAELIISGRSDGCNKLGVSRSSYSSISTELSTTTAKYSDSFG